MTDTPYVPIDKIREFINKILSQMEQEEKYNGRLDIEDITTH